MSIVMCGLFELGDGTFELTVNLRLEVDAAGLGGMVEAEILRRPSAASG
jgi:hypothetical protein